MTDPLFLCYEAAVLEEARQRLVEKQGNAIEGFHKTGGAQNVQKWLDDSQNTPILEAVSYAFAKNGQALDGSEGKFVSSLRYRVLAKTVTLPITVDDPESHEGVCAHLQYIPGSGAWDCRVSGNQSKADTWHQNFGYGPACPFWEHPNKESVREVDEELGGIYEEIGPGGNRPT